MLHVLCHDTVAAQQLAIGRHSTVDLSPQHSFHSLQLFLCDRQRQVGTSCQHHCVTEGLMDTSLVVLDYGSKTIRAGFAAAYPSDEEPRVRTPSLVEVERTGPDGVPIPVPSGQQPSCSHPVQRGAVTDIDALESLIFYCLYNCLGWELGHEGAIVIAEPLLTGKRERERMTQLMFEVFNLEALFFQDQATLSLYGIGKLSGCVVDVGHGKIDVATVTDGQVIAPLARRFQFGGQDMTSLLQRMMAERGHNINDKVAQKLKEMCCKAADTAVDYQSLLRDPAAQAAPGTDTSGEAAQQQLADPAQPQTYTLPDGQSFTLRTEGYQLSEILFDNSILGQLPIQGDEALEAWAIGPSLQQAVSDCIAGTTVVDPNWRKAAHASNVLVCGGGACIPGITSRLMTHLKESCAAEPEPAAAHVPEYMPVDHSVHHAAWHGGAVLGKVLTGQGGWITKLEYEDMGPSIGTRKCA